jgi:hypothetical protein
MSVLKEISMDIAGSAVCGGVYCLGEKFIGNDQEIGFNKTTGIRFATSAGSHLGADLLNAQLSHKVAEYFPTLAQYERLAVQPVLSGGILLLLDMLIKMDTNQTKTYKFLLQVGSSAASNYGTGPIRNALGI